MSISTKKGDNGDTSLFDGTRIGKNSTTIDAIGISDELNAMIGLIQSKKYKMNFLWLVQILQHLLEPRMNLELNGSESDIWNELKYYVHF